MGLTSGFCFKTDKSDTRGTWQCLFDPFFVMLGVFIYPTTTERMSYYTVLYGIPYLIPFFLSLFVIGFPLIVVEIALGQFSRSGEFQCWRFARIVQGIGLAKIVYNGVFTIIIGVINSWYIYYMVVSFSENSLPWRDCDHEWIKDKCYSYEDATIRKGNCSYAGYSREGAVCVFDNKTGYREDWSDMDHFPSSQYFRYVVYGERSKDAPFSFDLGEIRWIAISYLASFVLTFLALSMSVKTYGKVAYFTTIVPIILGIYLLVEGLNLSGYEKGTGAMLNRQTYQYDLEDITSNDKGRRFDPQSLVPYWTRAWSTGVFHVFYGLSLCTGIFTTIGSYNRKNTNFIWDVLVAVVLYVVLTFFFSYIQSSFIGHLLHLYGVQGPKHQYLETFLLKFKAIAHVFTIIRHGSAISGVYFMMQFLLGLNLQMAGVETLRTAVVDIFPRSRRILVLLGVCVLMVLLGLPLLTDNGYQFLNLVDSSFGFWTFLFIPLTQCIAVVYLYAIMTKEPLRIFRDMQTMNGKFVVNIPMIWCMLCWAIFIPVAMIMMIYLGYLHFLDNDSKIMWDKYDKAEDLAWVLAVTVPVLMVIGALMALLRVVLNWFRTRRLDFLTILRPTSDWGKLVLNVNGTGNNDTFNAMEMNRNGTGNNDTFNATEMNRNGTGNNDTFNAMEMNRNGTGNNDTFDATEMNRIGTGNNDTSNAMEMNINGTGDNDTFGATEL